MKNILLSIVALTFMTGSVFAEDYNNTGVSVNVAKDDISFGYANGTHADFADDAEVFSLSYGGLPVDFGLQVINDNSVNDYRLNLSKRVDYTLINLNVYGVAEAHYDFGDSYADNRLVLSPYVGVEMPVGGITPYAELGYDIASTDADWVDFNQKYSDLWPVITQMRPQDTPADAEEWHGVADKMKYFSEEPGKGD